ncbi:unnamed protein product (macronuclear) [Paramecium tetraurelia]|uniref:Uncharacterized protein n=1 Tax=Paramecium tetraurelia TaxID=5888 RepID=A0CY20_PARTE|nr:uncharacterized protein GSPATT00011319001 [Paramecium tetraurelia]CAK75687.1 unnamed protein product [Paramecium tetraurelia]|eukprot:XP_001443084.1 hypothetical protein (macronuclear) [Paramecium tetraurelia strain d4-2]
MRSVSPNAYQPNKNSFSSEPQQQKPALNAIVHQAVPVPVNEQIVYANKIRQNMSPVNVAPKSGQTVYRTQQSPNNYIPQQTIQQIQTFPQQKELKLPTSAVELQHPQQQFSEIYSAKSDDRLYRGS